MVAPFTRRGAWRKLPPFQEPGKGHPRFFGVPLLLLKQSPEMQSRQDCFMKRRMPWKPFLLH